jgi:hypothetical protein
MPATGWEYRYSQCERGKRDCDLPAVDADMGRRGACPNQRLGARHSVREVEKTWSSFMRHGATEKTGRRWSLRERRGFGVGSTTVAELRHEGVIVARSQRRECLGGSGIMERRVTHGKQREGRDARNTTRNAATCSRRCDVAESSNSDRVPGGCEKYTRWGRWKGGKACTAVNPRTL